MASMIYHLRSLNNVIKSTLISNSIADVSRSLSRGVNVIDLGCGQGGDLLKWFKSNKGTFSFSKDYCLKGHNLPIREIASSIHINDLIRVVIFPLPSFVGSLFCFA